MTAGHLPPNLPNPADLCTQLSHDPLPDPEPSVPSLPEPDPGVFHHEPGTQATTQEPAQPEPKR